MAAIVGFPVDVAGSVRQPSVDRNSRNDCAGCRRRWDQVARRWLSSIRGIRPADCGLYRDLASASGATASSPRRAIRWASIQKMTLRKRVLPRCVDAPAAHCHQKPSALLRVQRTRYRTCRKPVNETVTTAWRKAILADIQPYVKNRRGSRWRSEMSRIGDSVERALVTIATIAFSDRGMIARCKAPLADYRPAICLKSLRSER